MMRPFHTRRSSGSGISLLSIFVLIMVAMLSDPVVRRLRKMSVVYQIIPSPVVLLGGASS